MDQAAAKRLAEAATGERNLTGKIDALGNAVALRYPELTEWERDFAGDLCNRWALYGAKTRVSAKQMEIIERIYAKISHYVVI